MIKNDVLVDRRVSPQWRKFVRFEFILYLILHVYTCYVILADFGLLFAAIAAICPIFPELIVFVMGIMSKNLVYVSVFSIVVVLIIVNAVVTYVRDRSK